MPTVSSEQAFHPMLRLAQALTVRDYRLLWSGGMLSYISDWMDQVTLAWLVYTLTNSAVAVALLHSCRFLPLLVFGLWGGVLADRFDRRALLLRTQFASALVTVGLAVVSFQESPAVWLVFVLAIARGSLLSFDRPSRHALMPLLVPKPLIMNAVALQSAAHNLSRVLGPAIAGALIAAVGVSWSLVFTASLFVPNLAALFALRVPQGATGRSRSRGDGGIVEGLRYVWSNRLVAALLGTTMVLLILLVPHLTLLPVIARDVLDVGAAGFGLLNAAAGLGSLVGTAAIAWMGSRGAHGRVIMGGALAFSLSVLVFAASTWYPVALLLIGVVGFCSQAYFTTSMAVLQVIVPDELRGRVMSIYLMDRGVVPAGSVLAGYLATLIGVPLTLGLLAIVSTVFIIAVVFLVPSLRSIDLRSRSYA